jgi:hypothetical protein
MKNRQLIVLVAILSGFISIPPSLARKKATSPAEQALEKQTEEQKGISVGTPKLYDDTALQQMLSAAQMQLGALQALNQTSLVSGYGAITGANLSTSSFGLNIGSNPAPQVATTLTGPTSSTTTTAVTGSTPSTTLATTTAPASESTTTTYSPPTAPPSNAATPTASLPTSYGVSASDILNEQMQLTYEIANLRLLLEGSLNDRVVQLKEGASRVKPRVTIGFPITLRPDCRYKSAVAVVEVTVSLVNVEDQVLNENEPIAITALLPREKTYNVAAITEHDTAIGAGIVTHAMVGASVGWGLTHQKYYVVQDQDTVALTFQPDAQTAAGFLWEFRPVLGRSYVVEGLKQTFVQLAFPALSSPKDPTNPEAFARVKIRTYWRRYDRCHGLVLGVVKDSLRENVVDWPVPRLTLPLSPSPFSAPNNLEDLANGKMRVTLNGPFLDGTAVRIGSTVLHDGTPGFVSDLHGITFEAPINDLATKKVDLVARDGTDRQLLLAKCENQNTFPDIIDDKDPKLIHERCVSAPGIESATVSAVDESNSLLTVKLNNLDSYLKDFKTNPLVIVVGGHTFGYSDAPIERSHETLRALVSTAFLSANRVVTVAPLLAADRYRALKAVTDLNLTSLPAHLALLETTDHMSKFLLYGNRLKGAKVISPDDADLCPIGRPEDEDSLRLLVLPAPHVKQIKEIVLQRLNDRPVAIAVPKPEPETKKPIFTAEERVTVGSDEVIIVGEGLDRVKTASFHDKPLQLKLAEEKLHLSGLKAAGATASAATVEIDLTLTSGKDTVSLEVVSSKVETVAK